MECPNCKRGMSTLGRKVTTGNSGKKYDAVQYRCMNCDTWAEVETPQETDES